VGLSITDAAKEQIVIAGFDPVYGARPLRRAIQKLLENPISEMIIGKKAQDGDIIVVDFQNDFIFKTEKPQQVMAESIAKKASEAAADVKLSRQERVTTPSRRLIPYVCIDSGMQFETEEAPNSTVICPFNAKEKTIKASDLQVKEVKNTTASQQVNTMDTTAVSTSPAEDTSFAGAYQATA
jgi:hypothetical protein